jgi:putative membrane protein
MKHILIALLILYALLIAYVNAVLITGGAIPGSITPISTLAGFSFAILHASNRMGWKKALGLLALVFIVSLTFESVGVATGLVYGPYHYTEKLGPRFLGLVPYLIAVAWFMMMYPSYVIADWLTPSKWTGWKRTLTLAAIGGLAMTAWDVVMDPIMVAGGHWVWEVDGAFFGIPLQNYWGWWLTVFVTFVLFQLFTKHNTAGTTSLALDKLALTLYTLTAIGQILTGLTTGLAGPALAGIFAMLPWVLMGWMKMTEK